MGIWVNLANNIMQQNNKLFCGLLHYVILYLLMVALLQELTNCK